MIHFKSNVNKTTIYTSQGCNIPNIGEHIIIPNNPKEYKVIAVISVVDSPDKTIIIQPIGMSHMSYSDYLD